MQRLIYRRRTVGAPAGPFVTRVRTIRDETRATELMREKKRCKLIVTRLFFDLFKLRVNWKTKCNVTELG